MDKRYKRLAIIALLGALLCGCNSLIYDNMSECPQGVYVKLYTKTPCAADTSYVGGVSNLHLFAFDKDDVLVSFTTHKNADLNQSNQYLIPISNGYYTVIAWAGVDATHFEIPDFEIGKTTKQNLMLRLRAQGKIAQALGEHQVWQGESPVVYLQDPAEVGSQFKYTSINLNEITNRISVEVELHESVAKKVSPEEYEVVISSANSSANINATMPLNNTPLTYPSNVTYTNNSLVSQYTLMALKTGYNNLITIRNKTTGDTLWEGDLLGALLLKSKNANLECDHDFNVKFVVKDKCLDCGTYICWSIYVNDWQIHSYQTELDAEY